MDFIALDVETANQDRISICQIGLVTFKSGRVVHEYGQLIKPPKNLYTIQNTNIHGINAQMTKNSPTFDEVWDEIMRIVSNQLIVAHNIDFDLNCIEQTISYYGLLPTEVKTFCTYKATGKKLTEVSKAYNIKIKNHHDALHDAKLCGEVFLKLHSKEIPDYSKVKFISKKSRFLEFEGHEQLGGDILKVDLQNADSSSPFYNKKVVFTGVLYDITRLEAAEILKKLGADINTSISKKTNYIIIGDEPGPSKMEKIKRFQDQGYDIQLIYEPDFLEMISEYIK